MKRRLRKKRRLGEFQELGFAVSIECDPLNADDVLDEFIAEAVETNGLIAGGGGTMPLSFFVTLAMPRGSATEKQRQAVELWLASNPKVLKSEVGPLRDAWHN